MDRAREAVGTLFAVTLSASKGKRDTCWPGQCCLCLAWAVPCC